MEELNFYIKKWSYRIASTSNVNSNIRKWSPTNSEFFYLSSLQSYSILNFPLTPSMTRFIRFHSVSYLHSWVHLVNSLGVWVLCRYFVHFTPSRKSAWLIIGLNYLQKALETTHIPLPRPPASLTLTPSVWVEVRVQINCNMRQIKCDPVKGCLVPLLSPHTGGKEWPVMRS